MHALILLLKFNIQKMDSYYSTEAVTKGLSVIFYLANEEMYISTPSKIDGWEIDIPQPKVSVGLII